MGTFSDWQKVEKSSKIFKKSSNFFTLAHSDTLIQYLFFWHVVLYTLIWVLYSYARRNMLYADDQRVSQSIGNFFGSTLHCVHTLNHFSCCLGDDRIVRTTERTYSTIFSNSAEFFVLFRWAFSLYSVNFSVCCGLDFKPSKKLFTTNWTTWHRHLICLE